MLTGYLNLVTPVSLGSGGWGWGRGWVQEATVTKTADGFSVEAKKAALF